MSTSPTNILDKARRVQAALSSGAPSFKPEQYVAGVAEFYERQFATDARALIPRWETAYLAREAVAWCAARDAQHAWNIADIGTGSGVIAVSVALRLPNARIVATDISGDALNLAGENAHRHDVSHRIQYIQGSLLEPITQPLDVIVANLPYLSAKRMAGLAPEVRDWEPYEALYGGEDGFDLYRQLFKSIREASLRHGHTPKLLLCEIDDDQGELARQEVTKHFPEASCVVLPDASELTRYVKIEW